MIYTFEIELTMMNPCSIDKGIFFAIHVMFVRGDLEYRNSD